MDQRLITLLVFVVVTVGTYAVRFVIRLSKVRRIRQKLAQISKHLISDQTISVEALKLIYKQQRQYMLFILNARPDQIKGDREVVLYKLQEYIQKIEELLVRIGVETQEIEKIKGDVNLPDQRVPLLPMLGFMSVIYAWMLEFSVFFGRWFTNGKWPTPVKGYVITVVFVLITIYDLTLCKKHQKFFPILGKAKVDGPQILMIVLFVVFFGAGISWLWWEP